MISFEVCTMQLVLAKFTSTRRSPCIAAPNKWQQECAFFSTTEER